MRRGTVAVVAMALLTMPGLAGARSPKQESYEQRIRRLEQLLRETQDELKALKGQVQQQRAVGQATSRELEETTATAKAASEATKKVAAAPDWLSKITIFGDVRFRHEGFYNQPDTKGTPPGTGTPVGARNRERIRARLGVKFAYNDELSATIRGASGNANDPISTNETLTNNFTRKNFNLDWAFVTFTPGNTFGIRPGLVSVSAGKMPLQHFRVGEMVFDEDLSPEGIHETVQLLDKPLGNLDQIRLHAMQWTFNEVSNMQDGWMFGGQVNPVMHFGPVQVEGGFAQYSWLNPDSIAVATSKNSTSFTSSGAAIPNSSFNSSLVNTNLVVNKTIQPPTPAGGKKPASFTSITGFQSGFNQSNVTLQATVPDVVAAQPLRFFFDYVYNWDAASDDAHGWQAGMRLGQTKVRGDWSVYGLYEHLGQEAAISAFAWSDFGPGGTNQEGPLVGADYQLLGPFTVSARSWFTNTINRTPNVRNPTLVRLQLDGIVKW